jgi:acyl dehydratase
VTAVTGERPPLLHVDRTWEDQPVGFAFRTRRRTVTEADLACFVGLGGFTEELFTTTDAGDTPYAGRLVPGALVFVVAEGLVIQTGIISTGLAYLGCTIDVVGPTYVGDTLEVHVEVTESRPTSDGRRGFVRTLNTVLNQHREVVLTYDPKRLVRGASS